VTALVGVDVGGTFTDVVVSDGGRLTVWKVPSTPSDPSEGFERGMREALARANAGSVSLLAHGTTVATNAVLERRGARAALVTTIGFRDVLIIGRQNRPSLYDLLADRPAPLVPRELAAGVRGRVAPDGSVVEPLDERATADAVDALLAGGAESIAVCLLFSFANPAHERILREAIARRAPGVRVSLSSDVLPEFREYERASTTVLDAYVGPVVEGYVGGITRRLADVGAPIVVMRSGGGTMTAAQAAREPVHTLLSGPAAGVRGAVAVARAAGFEDLVTFDMGGTSTDVCLVERGEPAVAAESRVGGLPFRTPALAVHTVGAGGGSILWVDPGGALRAGPRSAGADPGPACYGRGGVEPTVTDAHLVLGHLEPDRFLGGRMRLDAGAAQRAVGKLAESLGAAPRETAEAALAAVRAQMAAAIRVVTVEQGRDPRDVVLVAFGGAGPMHACALASELGIETVLVPPAPGVLSALGLLAAPLQSDASLTRPMTDPSPSEIDEIFTRLEEQARSAIRAQGSEPARVALTADCRYQGQSHEVQVSADDLPSLAARFGDAHRARFGWDAPGEPVEIVTCRVRAWGPEPRLELPRLGRPETLRGPLTVHGSDSTVLIEDGWAAKRDESGAMVVRRA
jgi:N-methylhydantoinase A